MTWASSQGAGFAEMVQLVRQAAEKADAANFIDGLTSGHGTSVGPRGTSVSGGQRQRIALAQSLIRDPEILILDEATASVDSASEKKMQAAIEHAAPTNIIVLEAGGVVERGTYDELMAVEGGKFAHLIQLQKLRTTGSVAEVESRDSASLADLHDKVKETPTEKDEGSQKKAAADSTIETSDEADNTPPQPFSSVVRGIAWLIRPSLGWVFLAMVAATIVGATFSGSGLIFGYTVSPLNPCQSTVQRILSMGRLFGGLIFMLGAVELIANFLAWWGFGVIGERILYTLRQLSFRSLLEQKLDGIYRKVARRPGCCPSSPKTVPQDPALFDGTVLHNVALGAVPGHEASNAEIKEACRVANIHDEIMALPDGYNTQCGPSASRLSGGQKQRIAIARALVRRPRLLLLDESTSALDAAGEAELQKGLQRASKDTTVLAITHRLHTVHQADMIFVVDGGRIVDQGRHSDLLETNESYRLNAMQQMLQ
ncbi:ABC multidrug transporter protein [Pochonia chlamydosporia 170]|uniref:ABC multidrug transporter protein n=1 Tax=Pochonia chlamydosporia 170 TaxID=1380566 RepID=A0A179F5S8_METCM|nr:ABC multidrug transporter protein [Pochonia chlamydosporia 170]OAQ60787.1 ABC multidrug transporter protein [Pochonia chlamydosporia 170]